MTKTTIPAPDCESGYTYNQLLEILGDDLPNFNQWMRGQTMALCEGRRYNHETKEYTPKCGGVAHGGVVYPWDLARYLDGLPVID